MIFDTIYGQVYIPEQIIRLYHDTMQVELDAESCQYYIELLNSTEHNSISLKGIDENKLAELLCQTIAANMGENIQQAYDWLKQQGLIS